MTGKAVLSVIVAVLLSLLLILEGSSPFSFKSFSLHMHPFALLLSPRTTQANLIPLPHGSPKILQVSLRSSLTLFFPNLRSLGFLFLFFLRLVQHYIWILGHPKNSTCQLISLSRSWRPPSVPMSYLKPLPSQVQTHLYSPAPTGLDCIFISLLS